MKKNGLSNSATAVFIAIGGAAAVFTIVLLLWLMGDSLELALWTGVFVGAEAVLIAAGFAVNYCIAPFIARRRSALKALGKDGITAVIRNPVARLAYKGVLELFKNNFPKAEEYLNLAFERSDIRNNQVFCLEWLIKLYEELDSPKLMWCYRKAAELSPDSAEAQGRLGHAYYTNGEIDKALYCYEQVLKYNPNDGYSRYSIARAHILRGEDNKAFEEFNQLLKINEGHPMVYAELAVLYAMHGDEENAQLNFNKAQLCGYKDPDLLNKRITAVLNFAKAEASGEDLPYDYYRRIEKEENTEQSDEKDG